MDYKLARRKQYETRLAGLDRERQSFVSHWRELSEYMLPRQTRFMHQDANNRGGKMNSKIIDNTATLAIRTLQSGMMSGSTNPARPWFGLTVQDTDLAQSERVKDWLQEVVRRMRDVLIRSNFYNAMPMMYSDLGTFGTAAMAVMEDEKQVVRFYPQPIGSYWIAQNERGVVDTFYREFRMTVRQSMAKFGKDKVSPSVLNLFNSKQFETWVDVCHVIEPNENADEGKLDAEYLPFSSVYFEKGIPEDQFLERKGFHEFPILAPRWDLVGEDTYGHSPGMVALGDVKQLQLEQKRKMQAIDKLVNPPMVASSALRNQRSSLLPGDVTYIDPNQGNVGFSPAYSINPHIQELMMDIQETQGRIKRAFFEDLFLMIAQSDRRQITAREIDERHEEKLLMLGPVLERLNEEAYDPAIDRVFNIMARKGMLPKAPQELEGAPLKVEYVSIMAQAQKMIGTGSLERFAQFAGGLAQFNAETLDKIDFDEAIDEYGQMTGVSTKIVRDKDEVAVIRDKRAAAQQQAAAAEQAAVNAQTAKTMADTNTVDQNALTDVMEQMGAA